MWSLACGLIVATLQLTSAAPCEETPLTESGARIYAPGAPVERIEPIALEPGPHLFVDDYWIAQSEGLTREVCPPQHDSAIPNPVVTGREDGCFQPYMTVLRDTATGRFRLWYGAHTDALDTGRSRLGYLESADGIHWDRPARMLETPSPVQFGVAVVNEGPACTDSAQSYVIGYYLDDGIRLAASPDGFAWTPLTPDPGLKHNHDITGLCYDPARGHYVATVSVYRPGDWGGERRITMHSTSMDLRTWSAPWYVVLPDVKVDPDVTQFYAMDGYLTRGELMFGMVKVLHDDYKADDPPDPPEAYGVGHTQLAWTRDGKTWMRDTAPFFVPNPEKGTWDHAHAWIDEQVVVGDDLYLYYGGYARGHKVNRFEERQIGLVIMKRDRYVARRAGDTPGLLRTPLLRLNGGGALSVNTDADGGAVEARLIDAAGAVVLGFGFEDMTPISADAVDAPVKWKRPLAEIADTPVRFEFRLKNAALFGFALTASR